MKIDELNKNSYKLFTKQLGVFSIFASSLFFSANTFAEYVRTEGNKIVDENGEELFLNGINLGNWLLWEGYLMMGDFNYRTHTQFFNSLKSAFGNDEAKAGEFEHQWRLNYVDDKAIADLKALGFNSVRVPFNYNMFWKNNALSNHGFQYFDRLIESCRKHGIYVLLDMHAAPGYQNPGDHSDNVNSNASQPRDTVKFWDANNIDVASKVWQHIASRYKNEPVIWGYDLINEPVPQPGREFELLPSLIKMRNAIRAVDNNHTIVAEGSWWSSDLTKIDWSDPQVQAATGVSARWDDNLVYQLHHYGTASGTFGREKIAFNIGVPVIMGEYGESDNNNLKELTNWSKQNLSGYFPWSFKKMSHDKTLWTIPPNSSYEQLKTFINSGGTSTPPQNLYTNLITFAQNNIRNGHSSLQWHQGFYDAIKPNNVGAPPVVTPPPMATPAPTPRPVPTPAPTPRPVPTPTPKPAPVCSTNSIVSVPGRIEAENFCAMKGIQTESTSDTGSGLNIGWIDAGDWSDYKINVTQSANYIFNARVSSPQTSGQFSILVDGKNVGSIDVPNTQGWQNWKTVSTTVALAQGEHTLRLNFTGNGLNVNWFEIKPVPSAPGNTTAIKSGIYQIRNQQSGKVLDVKDYSSSNGGRIQQWDAHSNANQQWMVTNQGNGIYEIVSMHSGMCLDAESDGSNIQQWNCFGNENQKWLIKAQGQGNYILELADRPLVVEVGQASSENGAQIRQGKFNGSNHQQWRFELVK